ncbi:M48 family metallopeptidase [Lactococcus formosensis]|uniref:M48 family metallopeptidase n=1 Tax=Lactococcus formosensis TaxID=1281486 RepID=UPI0032460230
MHTITIRDIEINVLKKNIKNMYIRVLPPDGVVQISAPIDYKDEDIRMFALSKIGWIKRQMKLFENQPRQTKRKYVSGENIYLWGRRYRLEVVFSSSRNDIRISGERIILQVRPDSTTQQRENVLNEWYRKLLKAEIPELIEKYKKIIGVNLAEWHVKNMRTKWGTCNPDKKNIWINLQLAKKSRECLHYVIVHELVHLLERNHTEKFTAYMDQFYSEWRVAREKLNFEILDYMAPVKNVD